jgi:hypothetical protein
MRGLTKSTLSAGLAMSLFGMQALIDAFRRSEDGGRSRAVEDLDAVTEAMIDQTGDILRETFQVGDKLQRGLVDMTFGFFTLAPLRSGGGMSMMGETTRRATDQMRRWMGSVGTGDGGCGCGGPGADPTRRNTRPATMTSVPNPQGAPNAPGWGPMPDRGTRLAAATSVPYPPGAPNSPGWGPMPEQS